jgi:hypothetical protein
MEKIYYVVGTKLHHVYFKLELEEKVRRSIFSTMFNLPDYLHDVLEHGEYLTLSIAITNLVLFNFEFRNNEHVEIFGVIQDFIYMNLDTLIDDIVEIKRFLMSHFKTNEMQFIGWDKYAYEQYHYYIKGFH